MVARISYPYHAYDSVSEVEEKRLADDEGFHEKYHDVLEEVMWPDSLRALPETEEKKYLQSRLEDEDEESGEEGSGDEESGDEEPDGEYGDEGAGEEESGEEHSGEEE